MANIISFKYFSLFMLLGATSASAADAHIQLDEQDKAEFSASLREAKICQNNGNLVCATRKLKRAASLVIDSADKKVLRESWLALETERLAQDNSAASELYADQQRSLDRRNDQAKSEADSLARSNRRAEAEISRSIEVRRPQSPPSAADIFRAEAERNVANAQRISQIHQDTVTRVAPASKVQRESSPTLADQSQNQDVGPNSSELVSKGANMGNSRATAQRQRNKSTCDEVRARGDACTAEK